VVTRGALAAALLQQRVLRLFDDVRSYDTRDAATKLAPALALVGTPEAGQRLLRLFDDVRSHDTRDAATKLAPALALLGTPEAGERLLAHYDAVRNYDSRTAASGPASDLALFNSNLGAQLRKTVHPNDTLGYTVVDPGQQRDRARLAAALLRLAPEARRAARGPRLTGLPRPTSTAGGPRTGGRRRHPRWLTAPTGPAAGF
jgi:hypothetical protein